MPAQARSVSTQACSGSAQACSHSAQVKAAAAHVERLKRKQCEKILGLSTGVISPNLIRVSSETSAKTIVSYWREAGNSHHFGGVHMAHYDEICIGKAQLLHDKITLHNCQG
jgi:hypothetical protein